MAPRNGVKKRIVMDVCSWISSTSRRAHVGGSTATTVVSSGAHSSSLRGRSVITGTATDSAPVIFAGADSLSLPERSVTTSTAVGVQQTRSSMTPAERAVVKCTGVLPPSLAAGVDESLDGPALTRSNPTASILVKVPSADSLKYEGSRLYKDEKGDWVVNLVPENIAESDASSRTQVMGDRIDWPTPTMV